MFQNIEKKYPNANINICVGDIVLDTVDIVVDEPLSKTTTMNMDEILQELLIFRPW